MVSIEYEYKILQNEIYLIARYQIELGHFLFVPGANRFLKKYTMNSKKTTMFFISLLTILTHFSVFIF